MKDKLCLIPYADIEFDKTYTNVSEYFLRRNVAVSSFLTATGADIKIINGECSDYELLLAFLKACSDARAYDSAVARTFCRVIKNLLKEDTAFSVDAETLWIKTSEALINRKLRVMIASAGIEEIGVPILPTEFFDAHFSAVKGVSFTPVACPLGTKSVSFDTFAESGELPRLCESICDNISASQATAVFANGFVFEKPNEYTAAKAYEKHHLGQTLLNKEKAILSSQLLRMTAIASSESDRGMMLFLPFAPDVKAMGAVSEFIDYIDECGLKNRLKLSIFSGDAVSLCMTASIAGKSYKNITAVTGICGNGSDVNYKGIAKYWGYGGSAIENFASLAQTPALLMNR